MSFLDELKHILGIAQTVLPLAAAVNPGVANGAAAAEALMTAVKPLVDAGEQISNAAVAAGNPKLTGAQKLDMAKSAVESAVSIAQKSGMTTATFDQHWSAINPAITAVCAAAKVMATPATPAQ